jgi:hypothetical protein
MAAHHCKQLIDILKGKKLPIKTSIISVSTSKFYIPLTLKSQISRFIQGQVATVNQILT